MIDEADEAPRSLQEPLLLPATNRELQLAQLSRGRITLHRASSNVAAVAVDVVAAVAVVVVLAVDVLVAVAVVNEFVLGAVAVDAIVNVPSVAADHVAVVVDRVARASVVVLVRAAVDLVVVDA